jgi:hypothetical protein
MPLVLHFSFRGCCLIVFCVVFRVLNAIFIYVFLNTFVIFLVSFPPYFKVAHFVFRCYGSMSVFCFCEAGCFLFFINIIFVINTINNISIIISGPRDSKLFRFFVCFYGEAFKHKKMEVTLH